MTMGRQKIELSFLQSWKSRLGLLAAIITPVVALASAYYKLETKLIEDKAEMSARVSAVEITAIKSYAEKQDLKDIQHDLRSLRDDVTEIKILLKRR